MISSPRQAISYSIPLVFSMDVRTGNPYFSTISPGSKCPALGYGIVDSIELKYVAKYIS